MLIPCKVPSLFLCFEQTLALEDSDSIGKNYRDVSQTLDSNPAEKKKEL